MENPVASVVHHQRKATKTTSKTKTKTKTRTRAKTNTRTEPVKVVYIANPMKVKTCASNFRALVQELTGQHAGLPPDLTSASAANQTVLLGLDAAQTSIIVDPSSTPPPSPRHHIHQNESRSTTDFSFEPFDYSGGGDDDDDGDGDDDDGMLFPSTLFSDYSEIDVLGSLDAIM